MDVELTQKIKKLIDERKKITSSYSANAPLTPEHRAAVKNIEKQLEYYGVDLSSLA